ncbi:MAG: hypothetical protein ACK559_37365, partial [bacterium]
ARRDPEPPVSDLAQRHHEHRRLHPPAPCERRADERQHDPRPKERAGDPASSPGSSLAVGCAHGASERSAPADASAATGMRPAIRAPTSVSSRCATSRSGSRATACSNIASDSSSRPDACAAAPRNM